MRVDHGFPVVVRQLVDEVVAQDPGTGHEDVQAPVPCGCDRDRSLHVRSRGHVATDCAPSKRRGRGLGRRQVEVGDDDVRPFLRKPLRGRCTDPSGTARDESGLAREARALAHGNIRSTISATQTGFSDPSRSIVATRTACSPPATSSTEATVTRARIREPAGTGAGNRTRLVP